MRILTDLVVVALYLNPSASFAQLPAFSGAAGPGATATGGRVGDVYHVTNLEFDKDGAIPGSLKYGIGNAPAAGRTIVFDVGGTIFHDGGGSGWWYRLGKSNVTVAGQTAPGPGITIAGVGSKWTGDNVILRNITVRPIKDPVNPASFTYDAFATQLTNSIIDHMSASWHTDEGISSTDSGHTTKLQYALIGEGLNYDGHSFGSIINTEVDQAELSFHHILYAHNKSRMPRLGSETTTGAITNFANNVIYKWSGDAGYSCCATEQSSTNFLNSYYIKGNNNGSTIFEGGGATTRIYRNGANVYDGNKDGAFNGAAVSESAFAGTNTFVSSAYHVTGVGTLDTAVDALNNVLDYSGAHWSNRNSIDARIVQSVRDGKGVIINDLTSGLQTTEWATVLSQQASGGVAPFARDANWDTDQDGMPDQWETEHGLNPNVTAHSDDFDSDGYTDLEEYINDIAAWPAPAPIVFENGLGDNRFARIQNWGVDGGQVNISGQGVVTPTMNWQPSRYDTAVLPFGTVVVDAVGQHAGSIQVAPVLGNVAALNISGGWLKVADTLEIAAAGADGHVDLSGGKLRVGTLTRGAGGSFNFTGGTLAADEVQFDLVNNGGTIAPGDSPGLTQVTGDLTMNSGTLDIELGGTVPGLEHDQLMVSGNATLYGMLDVSLLAGYSLETDTLYEIIDQIAVEQHPFFEA